MLSELSHQICGPGLPQLSGNIYCVGRNYAEHARELQNELPTEPVIFLKAPAALRLFAKGPLAFADETFHHEVEIVLLLGRSLALGASAELSAIASLSLGLDLTRRGVQEQLKKKGLPWTIAKSFAGSALLQPFGPTALGALGGSIDFKLEVEGQLRQEGRSEQMLFNFQQILSYLASLHALEAGDLIYTGTPAGVGPLQRGQSMRLYSQALAIDARGIL